jgi:hypothetical protein
MAKKNDRPSMPIPAEIHEPFVRLIGAKAVAEVVNARLESEEFLVNEKMLSAYADSLFKQGRQPANPKLEIKKGIRPDLQGIFQVQDRYVVKAPQGDTSIAERIVEALVAAGLSNETAQNLVQNEVDCKPETSIRPLSELVEGHYENKEWIEATPEEQEAGRKLLAFVLGQPGETLTEAEMELVIRHIEKCKVKAGFLERVKCYCQTVEQVKAILHVICPVHFVSHCKFAVSDTPEERQARLVLEANRILGTAA